MPVTHDQRMAADLHEADVLLARTREYILLSHSSCVMLRQSVADLHNQIEQSQYQLREMWRSLTENDDRKYPW